MTFRKRRVSASRYNGNDIDDPLWISLVAVSSTIMKRVGVGGYKGLLPTEMNALYSEVPGAPNYNEEGFRSMFYHEIDEPVLPNQRPSDIGLATKYGLERQASTSLQSSTIWRPLKSLGGAFPPPSKTS